MYRNTERTSPRFTAEQVALGVLLVLFVNYSALFIFNTSFVLDGVRFFSLFDDAMISMRYAQSLAEGNGLVWNPGQPAIEGYTNFFWTLVMSGIHLLPVSPPKISLVVQVLSLLLLVINLILVRKLAHHLSNGSAVVSLGSVGLTAFYFPLNNWALQGMEVGLLVAITTAVVWLTLTSADRGIPGSTLILMAVGILTRTEMVGLFGAIVLFHTFVLRHQRRIDWRAMGVILSVVLLHTLFRYACYGDPLPNTYYLKLGGVPLMTRIERGLSFLWELIYRSGVSPFVLPIVLFLPGMEGRKTAGLLLLAVLLQCGYSVYVGGDAWEGYGGANRYIAIVMPLLFVLIAMTVHVILSRIREYVTLRLAGRSIDVTPAIASCVLLLVFYSFNAMHTRSLMLQTPPLEVENNEYMVRSGLFVKATTKLNATIGVVWAGAIPYFSGRPAIDLLGKNDRYIAHLPIRDPRTFTPGHDKWDYNYSIATLKPDVIVQLWDDTEGILPYIEEHYSPVPIANRRSMFYKKSSENIRYDFLEERGTLR